MDTVWKLWDRALDVVDWLADKVAKHPRKALLGLVVAVVLARIL